MCTVEWFCPLSGAAPIQKVCDKYSRLSIIGTFKGNRKKFELAGGSSYRGFELPRVDCIDKELIEDFKKLRKNVDKVKEGGEILDLILSYL